MNQQGLFSLNFVRQLLSDGAEQVLKKATPIRFRKYFLEKVPTITLLLVFIDPAI